MGGEINSRLVKILEQLYISNREILLLPMHYFFVGNDDRKFLNRVKFLVKRTTNIRVQNHPLSLAETMKIFYHAKRNVGMRFHSVLLQTVLHGNNLILDYTEPGRGKIHGFISDIDVSGFYKNRYIYLQDKQSSSLPDSNLIESFNQESIDSYYKEGEKKYQQFQQKFLGGCL